MAERWLAGRLADPRFAGGLVHVKRQSAVTPWYREEARAPPPAAPRTSAGIVKKTHVFAKRKKYYSSDSSASEKETDGHKEGVIHRAKGQSYDYFVYHAGKKITFGDSSMPNKNHNDKARANFNARHNCDEKKDKSKVRTHLRMPTFLRRLTRCLLLLLRRRATGVRALAPAPPTPLCPPPAATDRVAVLCVRSVPRLAQGLPRPRLNPERCRFQTRVLWKSETKYSTHRTHTL